MAKVQIFRNFDMTELEQEINKFIKDKELIDIKISTVLSTSFPIQQSIWATAVIIYKEEK